MDEVEQNELEDYIDKLIAETEKERDIANQKLQVLTKIQAKIYELRNKNTF